MLCVDVNDIANAQEVVPKQRLELERDLPIGCTEEFRQTVELGLREEVARLNFDIHLYGSWEASPVTKVLDLAPGFVFVEVEYDLMDVWRHTGVGRAQRTETFATLFLLLRVGITMLSILLQVGIMIR